MVHFRNLFRKALQKQAPEALAQLPARFWNQEWVVDNQAVGSVGYLARYIFKTATANRQLQQLPSGKVLWPYRDSKCSILSWQTTPFTLRTVSAALCNEKTKV
jgi:hypothetical protein